MMTIIYNHEHQKAMVQNESEHYSIYQAYKKGKYKATHKRITDEEFYTLPKLYIYDSNISVVTGSQYSGGRAYINHCKTFNYSIDRNNKVIFLVSRQKNDNKLIQLAKQLLDDKVTINHVSKELDNREINLKPINPHLSDINTDELEQIESIMSAML